MTDGFPLAVSQDDVNWLRQTNRNLWERDQLSIKDYVEELTQDVEELTQDVEELTQELAESHAVIEEKDAQLLAQMREIESLRAKLANKKATEKLS